jgi:hypothetical protein
VAAHRAENPPQQLGAALLKLRHDTPDHIAITYTNERGHGGDIALRRKAKTSRKPRGRGV